MEIINENYISITFEFNKVSNTKINEYRYYLMGEKDEINGIKRKKKDINTHNVPNEIDEIFINNIKEIYNKNLDDNISYLYPLDFSIIKRVVHTIKVGEKQRFTNKPAGIMVLYKYMGPLTYIKEFLTILKSNLNNWRKGKNDVFYKTDNFAIILGSELKYITRIINQNYFILHFEFNHPKADPNDFRRALLGLKRIYKGEEKDFHPNIPKFINKYFIKKIKDIHNKKLEENVDYVFPIDFSIIKRPIIYDNGKKSDFAKGVMVLYKYMGPLIYIDTFKEEIQMIFKELGKNEIKKEDFKDLKNSYFLKSDDPLIIIGADLKYYKGF